MTGFYGSFLKQIFWFASLLAVGFSALADAELLSLSLSHDSALGRSAQFLKEPAGRLQLPDAVAAYQAGRFTSGTSPVLNFGIGSKPVWLHFSVDNPAAAPVHQRLSIETAWLDRIDVYVLQQDRLVATRHLGDRLPFPQRPFLSRHFVLDHAFGKGLSDVYIRVETPDPMVIPLYLTSPEVSQTRLTQQGLSYGIVYGFLFALMAYNAILYASLRSARYFTYALYLMMFMAMNIAYTGHGFAWLWPDSVNWQQWSNPILMVLYGFSGLLFAIRFLDLRRHFPRVRKVAIGFCTAIGTLLIAAILLGNQEFALLVAFGFVFLFTGIMLYLGAISVRAGQKPARYFLVAALAAMVGALLTTLSVWGFIPHNNWTFRAVEIGMLLDATLLALALAYQFRVGQEERMRAVQLAQMDPLTSLNNRRAFYDKTSPLWSHAIRHEHAASVMLLDIDLFKQINDAHGHAHGDQVLKATADILKHAIRQDDLLARWGGEEFIVFLPETDIREASALAERLRLAIAGMRIPDESGETAVTASFGVAQQEASHLTLDALIAAADECLYQSKQQGRNRVTSQSIGQPSSPLVPA